MVFIGSCRGCRGHSWEAHRREPRRYNYPRSLFRAHRNATCASPSVKRIVLFVLGVAALSCSREAHPTQPTAPVQAPLSSFTGIWETEYRVVSCGSGRPWNCPAKGAVQSLTLRLEDDGNTVSGYILDDRFGQSPVSGPISGSTASLQGRSAYIGSYQSFLEVREMLLSRPSEDYIVGSLRLINEQPTLFLDIRGEILRTIRHSPLPDLTDYSGTWRGSYVVRKCVSDRQDFCRGKESEGAWETFELVIDDLGKLIRLGTAQRSPLFGTIGSSGLNLFSQEIQRSDERLTITRLSAVRNRVGQLSGDFTYVVREPRSDGKVETMTVDCDLVNVVQVR